MAARVIIIFIFVAFLAIACSDENSSGPVTEPEALINRISVESDSVDAQSRFSIDVTVENKDQLTGVVVPLHFSGESFTIDSISYNNSRFDTGDLTGAEIYPDESKIVFWHYPQGGEVIDSGSGVGFTVFLWIWGNAPTQDIVIDTTSINFTVSLGYMDSLYNYFVPDFEQGMIHVESVQPQTLP